MKLKRYSIIIKLFELFMVLVYAGVGAMFFLFENFAQNVTGITRILFGLMLLAYSAFRAYRIYKFNNGDDENV